MSPDNDITSDSAEIGGRRLEFAGGRSQGTRDYQEDDFCFYVRGPDERPEGVLLVVSDGMGGHAGGGIASSVATDAFVKGFARFDGGIDDALRSGLDAANEALAQSKSENSKLSSMGCTLVAAFVSPSHLHWISVGDSPLWLVRGSEMARLNKDHSMKPVLAGLVKAGQIGKEEAARDPSRNSLRSAVTGEELALVDGAKAPVVLERGDTIVLASDGLLTLSDGGIRGALTQPVKGAVRSLLDAVESENLPSQDNTTTVVLQVEPAHGLLQRLRRRLGI